MSFLTAFGNFAPGVQQGYAAQQQIAAKAQEIQQRQMQLDQQKHQLAGIAAAFSGMGQPQGQPAPMPQPMAPGQPSQAAVPQQPVQQGPQTAAPSPAAPAPGGPPSPPGVSLPQQPQGQPGAQSQAPDAGQSQDPTKLVMQLAQEIKARNPGISPTDLFYATEQVINLSKGVDPTLRLQAMYYAQAIRQQIAQQSNQTRENIAGENIGSREKIAGENIAGRQSVANTNVAGRLQAVATQGQNAMARTQFIQGQLNDRFKAGQGNQAQRAAAQERVRAITAQLNNANKLLATLKNSTTGQVDENDPRVKQAESQVQDATRKLDQLQKALNLPAQGQPAPAGGGAPDPLGIR